MGVKMRTEFRWMGSTGKGSEAGGISLIEELGKASMASEERGQESCAGPGHAGPWKGFSDIYLKVSRKPLGSFWGTGDRHCCDNTIRCMFRSVTPAAWGDRTAGAQLGGHPSVVQMRASGGQGERRTE